MNISKLKRKDFIRLCVPYPVRQFIRALAVNKVTGEIIGKLFQEKIPHRGCRIDTSAKRIDAADKAALFFHLYERSEIDQTIAYLDNNYDVIELGGSIGANSTQIVRRVTNTAKVIIVEADPEICGILSQNISNNSSHPHVFIINAAIDYSGAGKVLFASPFKVAT